MAGSAVNPRVKAFVLLNEKEYLKENIRNPECYLHSLKRSNILTEAQCQEVKNLPDINGIIRLVELLSSHERGFDVFTSIITRKNNENRHIVTHLKKKVKDALPLFEGPLNNMELPVEQQHRLMLLEFLSHFRIGHDWAEDILKDVCWDLQSALQAARDMGLSTEYMEDTTSSHCDMSSRLSNSSSMCDSGEYGFSPGSSTNSSNRSSSSDILPNNDVGHGICASMECLPPVPPDSSPSPISPGTSATDFHPGHGPLPHPPQSPSTKSDPKSVGAVGVPPTTTGNNGRSSSDPHTSSPVQPSHQLPPSTSAAVTFGNSKRPTTLPTAHRHSNHQAGAATRTTAETKSEAQPSKFKKNEAIGRNPSPASPVENEGSHSRCCVCKASKTGEITSDELPSATRTSPKSIGQFSGPYWVCYHCNEPNKNEDVVCLRCNMLVCDTHPSWEVDDDSESTNYVCKQCLLPVRIPCKPCPPSLVSCLRKSQQCNKCYRASCQSAVQPALAPKVTFLNLQRMREDDGKKNFSIIDEVASRWDSLAPHLDIPAHEISILMRDNQTQCRTASHSMFKIWVDRGGATWKQLLDGLRNIDHQVLAGRIEAAINE